MTPERWRQIEELYDSVQERALADRATLLAQADPELRREVEAMLAQDASGKILDQPAKDLLTDSRLSMVGGRHAVRSVPNRGFTRSRGNGPGLPRDRHPSRP